MTIKKCKDCKKVLRIYSRGLCTTCYQRLRRLGKLGKYKSVRVIRWKRKDVKIELKNTTKALMLSCSI